MGAHSHVQAAFSLCSQSGPQPHVLRAKNIYSTQSPAVQRSSGGSWQQLGRIQKSVTWEMSEFCTNGVLVQLSLPKRRDTPSWNGL